MIERGAGRISPATEATGVVLNQEVITSEDSDDA